jgi:hypothetical protein
MSRFPRPLVALCIFFVIAGAIATVVFLQEDKEERGVGALTAAANRRVQNVQCEGECERVILVSSQEPNVQYFGSTEVETCTEINLWANQTAREGQLTIGGYGIYRGQQRNLRTRTVEGEAIDGREISYTIPKAGSGDDSWSFLLTLRERQEWNVLDTLKYSSDSAPIGVRIMTERDGGFETLVDTCASVQNSVAIYDVYQAPELHGAGESDTYRVGVGQVSSITRSDEATPTSFEQVFSSEELESDVLHVRAPVGEAIFRFDLVRD